MRAAALVSLFLLVGQSALGHDLSKGIQRLTGPKLSALDNPDILTLAPEVQQALFSIVLRDRVWQANKVTVCFGPADALQNRQSLIKKIISVAEEWTAGAKVSFDWGSEPYRLCTDRKSANVRVNISAPKSDNDALFTSLVGNESESSDVEGFEPYSMTLLFPKSSRRFGINEVFRFYILHEFGHALGFEHEHQRVDCNFNWPYVAKHFNFASTREAKENMGKIFSSTINAYPDNAAVIDGKFITTKYDNYSIMKYNLSTASSPGGDDPLIYSYGKKSRCYRAGWVSHLTKFDQAGMAKAYEEPLIAISSIAQNLREIPGALSAPIISRLSVETLGRADVLASTDAKLKLGSIPASKLTDEERSINSDFETLRTSPRAVEILKTILAERALH
jgi:hypothetical protein